MAKKDKEAEVETSEPELEEEVLAGDPKGNLKLAKLLIKELNKNVKEKVAWSLATDLDNPTVVKEFISTGCTWLDYNIGNRPNAGVPVGKLTEIVGEEATGKSLICAHLIRNAQKMGGTAVYIDTENAANPDFMARLGVDIKQMVYLQPGTIEEVGENIEKVITMIRAKSPNRLVLIIWDSVAGTPSQAEIDGTYDPNDRIGVTAKALAKMMRKLTQTLGKERICLVFTNQLKVKIGTMFGDPMTTPGGKAIPYHASVRIKLTRSTQMKDEDVKNDDGSEKLLVTQGIRTLAQVFKNRMGPPLRKCEFNILFSSGIDDYGAMRTFLHEQSKDITKSNGFMSLSDCPDPKTGKIVKEFKFREKQFNSLMDSSPAFKDHVLGLLVKRMIISYDTPPEQAGIDLDEDSLLVAEGVLAAEGA